MQKTSLVFILYMGLDVFRTCTDEQALEILRHESVLPFLSIYPEGVRDVEKYLLDEKALLIVMPQGKEVEVHIACKFRDRGFIRKSLEIGIQWLKYRGFECVFTTAPDNRKALNNLLLSLGFSKEGSRWALWV